MSDLVTKPLACFIAFIAQAGCGPIKKLSQKIFVLHVCILMMISSASTSPTVSLSSTLNGGVALPGRRVVFACITWNAYILEWHSDEYIDRYGADIQIYSVGSRNNVSSRTIPTTYATRVNVSVEDGVTVIESQLFITALEQFPTSSVTCRIYGQGPQETISFNTTVIQDSETYEGTTVYTEFNVTNETIGDNQDSPQNTSRTGSAPISAVIYVLPSSALVLIIIIIIIIIGLVYGQRHHCLSQRRRLQD